MERKERGKKGELGRIGGGVSGVDMLGGFNELIETFGRLGRAVLQIADQLRAGGDEINETANAFKGSSL